MGIYATFDAAGLPSAYWPDDPGDAVALTDAQWSELIDNPGRRRWDGRAVVPYRPGPIAATVAQLLDCLTDAEQAAVQAVVDRGTPAVRAWWASHYADLVPITAPKIVKVAARAALDLAAWYGRALTAS